MKNKEKQRKNMEKYGKPLKNNEKRLRKRFFGRESCNFLAELMANSLKSVVFPAPAAPMTIKDPAFSNSKVLWMSTRLTTSVPQLPTRKTQLLGT